MVSAEYDFAYDDFGNTREIKVHTRGSGVYGNNYVNKGTAFSDEERLGLGIDGTLPPAVRPLGQQVKNSLQKVFAKESDIERYIYMRSLFDRAQVGTADMTLEMTGVPVFAVATQSLVAGDVQRVTILATLALSLLYLWLFRSWRSLLWVSTLLAISLCSALLVTQLVFGQVHGLTIAIGATLIGVCIDYPIHAMVHASATPATARFCWPNG